MIEQIQLTNFRKHRDLTVNLTSGLNVIRGANEDGKTTINEAIAYAFYGARALRESLEDTVTWGEPSRSLRVRVSFTYDGVPGYVSRGESGAEVKYGATLASGQNEVTKFFETLFRVNAKMANNLQIASQNKVRGALEGGQAVALIESLADFSLLETLVDRIQSRKPCGNTGMVVDRLNRLKAATAAEVPAEPDAGPVEAARGHLRTLLGSLDGAQQTAKATFALAVVAQKTISEAERLDAVLLQANNRMDAVRKQLAEPLVVPTDTKESIDEMRRMQVQELNRAKLYALYSKANPYQGTIWQGTKQTFEDESVRLMRAEEQLTTDIRRVELELNTARMKRINEKVCSLCKKSLDDVPEVVAINAEADATIKAKEDELKGLKAKLADVKLERGGMKAVADAAGKQALAFPEEYWEYIDSQYPPALKWKGDAPRAEPDVLDYTALIKRAETGLAQYHAELGRRQALEAERERLLETLAQKPIDTTAAKAAVAQHELSEKGVANLTRECQEHEKLVALAEQAYRHAQELRNRAIEAAQAAAKEIEVTTKELADMTFHNLLIDKIRKARPVVANKLWALVMAAVGHYTTKGRAEPSTVTRDGDGFKINGKAVAAYSGSAQDVLGLAIRLALVKTFLPNSPFMIMDEVASACDDDRELNMLAMVMSAEIPQVLLVTHSDAAESFAANLVQL